MTASSGGELAPLELLAEPAGLPAFDLPEVLRRLYPGTLGFADEAIFANFVSTIDGVVSLPGVPRANRIISDESEADRFVMGLLRACADIVLIGSGTLRGSPLSDWTADAVFPGAAGAFHELRASLGLAGPPGLAVVTSGAAFPADHPVLARAPLLLTTTAGAGLLAGVGGPAEVVAVSDGDRVDLTEAVAELRRRGHGRILSEGGPHLLGSLLDAGLLDDLFLTVSPLASGRPGEAGRVLSLIEGVALLPGRRVAAALHGVRRHGSHLFLRYAF